MRSVGRKEEKQLLEVLTLLKKLDPKDVLKLVREKEKQKQEQQSAIIPISLFSATPLSSLEAITVYLRDVQQLTFVQMETLLGRNQIALSTSYRNAKKKYNGKIEVKETKFSVPCGVIANRQFSVLENITLHVKRVYNLPNAKIAKLLGKDPRTIWTVLERAKKKGVRT